MLDLAKDCFHFVTGYLEIISASSPHIYHSALVVTPNTSTIRKLYEPHAHPFVRVVHGVPTSWDPSTAAATSPSQLNSVVWSSCNKFIAITWWQARTVDILDSATLQRLQTLESPQDVPMTSKALAFSPNSRILTCSSCDNPDPPNGELYVVSWDLQTGGIVRVIKCQRPVRKHPGTPSITYSVNGEMVGVSSSFPRSSKDSDIFICDVASSEPIHSHPLIDTALLRNLIWTRGESFRFATAGSTTITIWEVGSTSGATPTEVETLPAPDGFAPNTAEFLPAACRLALVSRGGGQVQVWDARNSKYLLDCTDAKFHHSTSFSDGRFFACSTTELEAYLWKESPAGYILHGILVSNAPYPTPLLSQNGESIVTFSSGVIQLWRTNSSTILPSSILAQSPLSSKDFIVEFSPGGTLAVIAKREDNMVAVLDLKSGVSQLTINANIEVYGLGIIGNTIVAIGSQKVIIWDLSAEDYAPGAQVGIEDSSSTIQLRDPLKYLVSASISPDSRHIAVCNPNALQVHSGSTGELVWKESASAWRKLWFSPDESDVWCVDRYGKAEVWRVGGGRKEVELTADAEHPPEGHPWASSHGYQVTNDWWILGPDGQRLLMLPPPWRSYMIYRRWEGHFLTLLHRGRSEPVILDLEVNCDL